MGVKTKELKKAETLGDFVAKYREARTFVRTVLKVPIGETADRVLVEWRAKAKPGVPAKFLAAFDGTKFCLRVAVGKEHKDLDTLDLSKLPDPARGEILKQLEKFGVA